MSSLKGHHALVTGAGSGIGASIASLLHQQGAVVTLVGRSEEKLRRVARNLDRALVAPADVTVEAEVTTALATARARHGPVSILVNNAGAAPTSPFGKLSQSGWRDVLRLNLDAVFTCCRLALDDLCSRPAARIVNVASTAGLKGYSYAAAYVAAKHGVIGLTRALAAEFARSDLTVNAVCPGFTDTDLVAEAVGYISLKSGRTTDDALAQLVGVNPQGRLIDPAEVASAVLWLCRPENRSITGQSIIVAGGELT